MTNNLIITNNLWSSRFSKTYDDAKSDFVAAPFGKRGWKMVYTVLRDLILFQYKDEHQVKKGQFVESAHNVVRIHHALATKATDYTKKQHVFRLQTADWAEFLFQTG